MDESSSFTVTLTLERDYEFTVDFGVAGAPTLRMDEPAPLGAEHGPNAARVLAAAVGNCLGASLLYCLRRARIEVQRLETTVTGTLVRNERGRLRIGQLNVTLGPEVATGDRARMGRCLELFEEFCIVTQSVRSGIDVRVAVEAATAAPGAAPPADVIRAGAR